VIENWQQAYYTEMIRRDRAIMYFSEDNKLLGIVTFFIGDNDARYLTEHEPWTVLQDNPRGHTLYIDQLITVGDRYKDIRKGFREAINIWKEKFPSIKQIKWARVCANFRKKGEQNVMVEPIIMVRKLK
jgi:hypothetical protein